MPADRPLPHRLHLARRLLLGLLAAPLAALLAAAPAHPGEAAPVSTTYPCTGKIQTFTVPPGISSVTITAVGAAGGLITFSGNTGGRGASLQGTFNLPAGTTTLSVLVGCHGQKGASSGGGGGGSFVWTGSGSVTATTLLLAAGGGGGASALGNHWC